MTLGGAVDAPVNVGVVLSGGGDSARAGGMPTEIQLVARLRQAALAGSLVVDLMVSRVGLRILVHTVGGHDDLLVGTYASTLLCGEPS